MNLRIMRSYRRVLTVAAGVLADARPFDLLALELKRTHNERVRERRRGSGGRECEAGQ